MNKPNIKQPPNSFVRISGSKVALQTLTVIEATFKNLRGIKFNGLNPLRWVIGSEPGAKQGASPDILTEDVEIQNSS